MILPDNCYAQTGELRVTGRSATIPSTYPRLGGWAIDPTTNMPFVQDAGVAVPITSVPGYGGWRFTPDGALYVTFDSSTGPFTWINGFKTRQDGALVVLSRTGVPGVDPAPMGWSADGSTSAALIGGMTFNLPLADAGAGIVNLVPPFAAGSATPTFTRATTATTVLQNGLVASVASGQPRSWYDPSSFVTNFVLQSQTLNNGSWTKLRSSITADAIAAPDGTLTADLITEDTTPASTHLAGQTVAAVVAGLTYTQSVYAHAGTRSTIILQFRSTEFGVNTSAWFDLAAGVISNTSGGVFTNTTITALGSGWYRCSASMVATAAGTTPMNVFLSNTPTGSGTYDGDGVSGLYLWGTQWEQATAVGTYVPTTTTALTVAQTYGGYLAEGARTNLCLQSEDFSSVSWTKTDTTVTADNIVAPDGTITADLCTEGVAGTAIAQQQITATANVNYSNSLWVKRGNTDWLRFRIIDSTGTDGAAAYFNVATGVVGATLTAIAAGIPVAIRAKAYPNGWYRIDFVASVNNARTAIFCGLSTATADGNGTRINNGTYYVWGAQFENNVSFASSYIPTTTVAVSRNADVLTYPSAGNWSASSGSSYAELWTEWGLAGGPAFPTAIGIQQGVLELGSVSISTQIRINDSTTTATKTGLTDMSTAIRKRASAWGGTTMSATGDGASPQNAAFDGVQSVGAAIGIGCSGPGTASWFGTIKNAQIWTSKLPDATLSAITA